MSKKKKFCQQKKVGNPAKKGNNNKMINDYQQLLNIFLNFILNYKMTKKHKIFEHLKSLLTRIYLSFLMGKTY